LHSENSYIKAIGMLRTFNDKRSVKANRIIKIDDFNEVTHHILYCVHTKLLMQRGKNNVMQTSSTASTRLPAQVFVIECTKFRARFNVFALCA
jgi:hypothetical protein